MPGGAGKTRVRRKYPAKDVIAIGEKFFQFLGSTGHQDVTDKEDLRALFYDEFKPTLDGIQVCGFSTLVQFLKRTRKIKVKDGHVFQQKVYDSVSIDQYLTMRRAEEEEEGGGARPGRQGDAAQRQTPSRRRRYPCLCDLCGVKINSEVMYRDHIRGNRHRVNMLKKDINSKRGELIQNKNGAVVTSPYDDEKGNVVTTMQRGQSKDVVFTISAQCESGVALLSIVLLRDWRELQVLDEHHIFQGQNILKMPQGSEYEVKLTCSKPTNLGRLASPIVFAFRMEDTREIFQILRFVSITVVSDVIDDLPASKPYIRPPRFAAREKKGTIVEGYAPSYDLKNPLKGIQLPFYDVPKDLNRKVNNKRTLGDIKNQLSQNLDADNHGEKFHTLLYVEELQMQVDIRHYDKKGQQLTRDRDPRMLRLHVPGLAENRPSVLKGDHLFARFSDRSDDKSYKGYVHRVEQEDLVLGFHHDFKSKYIDKMRVDIEFTFSRYPLRNQHQAIETATAESRLHDALFPETKKINTRGALPRIPDLQAMKRSLFDRKLGDNPEQLRAVHSIVSGLSRPAPYLVFGPPGTGKTVTIVEAAKQVYKHLPKSCILVSAPSNSAADLVAVRLLSKGTPIAKTHLMRLYAPSRPIIALDPILREKKCCNMGMDDLYVPTKEEILSKRVIVTTLVNAGRLALAQFPKDFFTHVFIDEAGHATEPEAIIALSGLLNLENPNGGQVVLAGDPKQLGPVLRSPLSIEYGLALSFLERLMEVCPAYSRKTDTAGPDEDHYDSRILTKLLQNYRSHPDILRLPNEEFYDNELQVYADTLVRESYCMWDELPKRGFPIIFHGVEGQDEREEQSPSFFNKSEIEIVVDYVKKVMDKRGGQKIKEEDIGVISPYRKQVQKLRQVLKKRNFDKIKVGSVEEFQGQERLVIIISTVRSTKAEHIQMDMDFKLGFLKNPKRYNVSVTRAKALLVIVGNPFMLSKDEHWNKMLEFCIEKGGYRGCPYNAEEKDVDDIIELFKKVHLGELPAAPEEEEEGLDISNVALHNDPEWRREV